MARKQFLNLVVLLLTLALRAPAATPAPADCDVKIFRNPLRGRPQPNLLITLIFKKAKKFGTNTQYNYVYAVRRPNGKWEMKATFNSDDGSTDVAGGEDLSDDSAIDTLEDLSPGVIDRVNQAAQSGNIDTVARNALPPTPAGTAAGTAHFADLNGDGNLDVAALDRFSNKVALRLGNGSGGVQNAVTTATGNTAGSFTGTLAYSDFNHDGRLDLLIRYPQIHMLSLLTGNANGTSQPPLNYVAPGENPSLAILPAADGKFLIFLPDRTTNDLFIYQAQGDGSIDAAEMENVGANIEAATAADLDGDHKDELIVVSHSQLVVGRNVGTPGTSIAGPNPVPANALSTIGGDFNNDGFPDIIVTTADGNANVLRGSANGTLSAYTSFAAGTRPTHPTLGDFNHDGNFDLVVIPQFSSGGQGKFTFLLGNGQGGFGSPNTNSSGANDLTGVAVADFDGDHFDDIAVTTSTAGGFGAGNITIYRSKGDGTFQNPVLTPLSASYAVAAGDFSGDGIPDLAVLGSGLGIRLGNGNGTFQTGPSIPLVTSGTELQAVDLNRDGILDLINNSCCGEVRSTFLLGYGNGYFGTESDLLAPVDPGPAILGDFNGDGSRDVAMAGSNGMFTVAFGDFPPLFVVNSASAQFRTPDSIASGYGLHLATTGNAAGTTVTVKDSAGVTRSADTIFLILYGTGIRGANKDSTMVTIGGIPVSVEYAGLQGSYPGFDQVNIKLPRTLIGKGTVNLVLTANGQVANPVTLQIQ